MVLQLGSFWSLIHLGIATAILFVIDRNGRHHTRALSMWRGTHRKLALWSEHYTTVLSIYEIRSNYQQPRWDHFSSLWADSSRSCVLNWDKRNRYILGVFFILSFYLSLRYDFIFIDKTLEMWICIFIRMSGLYLLLGCSPCRRGSRLNRLFTVVVGTCSLFRQHRLVISLSSVHWPNSGNRESRQWELLTT